MRVAYIVCNAEGLYYAGNERLTDNKDDAFLFWNKIDALKCQRDHSFDAPVAYEVRLKKVAEK